MEDKLSYKEIETYIDEYIDMGGFTRPEEAKPYLMDGFEKGYYYKQSNTKQTIEVQRQDKKLICIDYDGTYTEAPELFDYFIRKAKELGYRVIGCTMRFEKEMDSGLQQFKEAVDKLYFSDRKAKKPYLTGLKIYPQIWIDDMPEWLFTDTI